MDKERSTSSRRDGPMGGSGRGIGIIEKADDFKGTIKKLIKYIGQYKFTVAIVILFALCGTVFSILGPKILGQATTEIFTGLMKKIQGIGGIDFSVISKILIIVLILYGVSTVFSFVQGILMTGVTQKICYRMRRDISLKINRMPMKYFETKPYGEVLSRITNDVDTLGNGLNQSITQLITSIATIIGVFIMMLSINLLMAIITLVILPISIGLIRFVVKKSQKHFRTQQEFLGHVNGQLEEVYSGHMVVKAFAQEHNVQAEFRKNNAVLYESAWKSQFLSGLMHPVMMFVGNLGYVAVAISGAFLAISGAITVGDIQAFFQYVRNFTQPIQQIAQISSTLQSMTAAAERVFAFMGEEEEEQIIDNPVHLHKVAGNVGFDHISFGYEEDKIIIKDFTLQVNQGQKIAIVGPTGAGKTTIVKLLMRYYDVINGGIYLDGNNLKDFNRRELRNAFGMVLQDTWLFQGTIMENIRYGRLNATDEEVIIAAKAAHVHHFIQTLPDGYQMELNEEASNVSQGQKQLLTIARAILADNAVLILDEATSSVDTRTELQIQQAMDNLTKGRTSFIIAHRLSTIKNADLILCLKDGDIVEQGSHDALMKQKAFYFELYNSQFEVVS